MARRRSNDRVGAQRYVLRGEGPPVSSDEVEHAARLAIEVRVSWDGDVLFVSHVAAPATVFVGDGSGCDVALPAELLGAERRCVAVSSRGDVCAVLAEDVRGWVTLPDGTTRPFDDPRAALAHGPAEPAERLLPLPLGHRAHLCWASLEIQVASVPLGRRCPRSLDADVAPLAAFALCAVGIAGVLLLLSRLAPAPGLNHDERDQHRRVRLLRSYLGAAAQRAPDRAELRTEAARTAILTRPRRPLREPAARDGASTGAELDTPPAPALDLGLALDAGTTPARVAIQRRAQIEEARRFGVIGMLDWPELNDPRLAYERQLDSGELALMQRLFNPDQKPIDDGPGGLNLSGTGIGGGGRANAIALGDVRTADEGQGGALDRFRGAALEPSRHVARPPAPEQPESVVSDPLAAASIRRAVRARRAALRGCYADAIGTPAGAAGALVRFVVRGNGQVEQVRATEHSLPDTVTRCIERVFLGLSVPNPVERPVHVAYRVALDS